MKIPKLRTVSRRWIPVIELCLSNIQIFGAIERETVRARLPLASGDRKWSLDYMNTFHMPGILRHGEQRLSRLYFAPFLNFKNMSGHGIAKSHRSDPIVQFGFLDDFRVKRRTFRYEWPKPVINQWNNWIWLGFRWRLDLTGFEFRLSGILALFLPTDDRYFCGLLLMSGDA